MTRSKAVIFAVFVAVMVVSMAAGAWYARRHQVS